MPSIPAFHVSNRSKAKGEGKVFIQSRQDSVSSGTFVISVNVQFDPSADDYPTGSIKLKVDLSDSLKASFTSTSIELINSHGKHNPTIFITGQCKTSAETKYRGLRYWVMLVDNTREGDGTPDIVGFVINDRNGNRVAYGTGPLKGNITVDPS